ncbi:hypothetical protein [Pectinatus frisingensis]|uniref:hypothetical protein n=1 Tax=Pectinatus frisingensis TaxID=865 RepID=UPI003D806BC6
MDTNILKSQNYWQEFANRVEQIEYFVVDVGLKKNNLENDAENTYMYYMHNYSAEHENRVRAGKETDMGNLFVENTEMYIAGKLLNAGFLVDEISKVIEKNSPLQLSKEQAAIMIKQHWHLQDEAERTSEQSKQKSSIIPNDTTIEEQTTALSKMKANSPADWIQFRNEFLASSYHKIDAYLENKDLPREKIIKPEKISSIMKFAKTVKTIKNDLVTYIKDKIEQRRRINKINNYSRFMGNFNKFKDHIKNIFKGEESIVVLLNSNEIFTEVSKNINYEYLQETNALTDKAQYKLPLKKQLTEFEKTDLIVAKKLLLKDFDKAAVICALMTNSPRLLSEKEAQAITSQAQKYISTQRIIKMPEPNPEYKTIADEFIVSAKNQLENRTEWETKDDVAVIKDLLQKDYSPEKIAEALHLISPNALSKENANNLVQVVYTETKTDELQPEPIEESNTQKDKEISEKTETADSKKYIIKKTTKKPKQVSVVR